MDRPIIFDQHDRFGRSAGHGTVKPIKLLEMRHEISTAFCRTGMDDKLARDMIERTQDGHFFRLPRGWHAQIGA